MDKETTEDVTESGESTFGSELGSDEQNRAVFDSELGQSVAYDVDLRDFIPSESEAGSETPAEHDLGTSGGGQHSVLGELRSTKPAAKNSKERKEEKAKEIRKCEECEIELKS